MFTSALTALNKPLSQIYKSQWGDQYDSLQPGRAVNGGSILKTFLRIVMTKLANNPASYSVGAESKTPDRESKRPIYGNV